MERIRSFLDYTLLFCYFSLSISKEKLQLEGNIIYTVKDLR
jgi:hypothetical protein